MLETQQHFLPQEDHWEVEQVINGMRVAVVRALPWAVVHRYQFLLLPIHLIICEYQELATQPHV